ncbi:hypothetical protein PV325_005869 [Microctonus aethiopoides]|uniref:AD domain-containing protein n=1 Tax=Microctonus aethiopoides TaxID=144406 RepID=A0AA39FZ59_9HYME|nr:hypothetical protein PV325_005869 [Microctonus aethiopoides]KAK0098794.1 hypothetical protein PV326_003135 [Microctonus aethiopoides]KAK0178428.1 hypothetical protein PV328_002377 [Microctonus aethiopoides]
MCNINKTPYSHKIYNNDPLLLKSYINKQTQITTEDSTIHQGILYTVDPVSESVVLIERENEKFHAKVIVGHSIKNIQVISNSALHLPQFFSISHHSMTDAELSIRRVEIKKLFTHNRFPVTENNDVLEIEGMLFIEPPYNLENCICTNPIILNRVYDILSQLNIE